MLKTLKYLKVALLLVFLIKAALPFYGALHGDMTPKNFSVLSKILGEEVIICTSANDSGFYLTSLTQIDKNSKNNKHHSNCFDCPYCSQKTADSKIFQNNFSDGSYYLKSPLNTFVNYSLQKIYLSKHKYPQAPPIYS